MIIAALVSIAKLWKQLRCLTTNDWIKEMWHIHKMEYYSPIKNNKILSFSGECVELENIVLNEVLIHIDY
jgi:hypothetical protein